MDEVKSRVNLALATLAFGLSFAAWSLLSPLAPQFQRTLHLTDTQTGVLLAVPVLLGSLARIPMGLLADRYGGRKLFTGLLLFNMVPVFFMGTVSSYTMILFWGFWLGMAGSSFAIGIPFVSRWFAAGKQGTALGIYGMGNIGTALAAYAAPWLAGNFGWPYAFWAFVPIMAVAALLFWLLAEDAPGGTRAGSISQSLLVIKREKLSWTFSLFYFVTFGGFVAFSVFLPKLLVDWFSLDKTEAGLRTAGFVVLATVMRPVGGYLSDRFGGARLLAGIFGIAPIVALWLTFEALRPDVPMVTTAFLAMASLLGLGNGAVFKLVAQYFPRNTGIVTGVVGAAGGIGGFFPPMVMGYVRDHTGTYAPGLLLLAAFILLCLAVDYWVLLRAQQSVSTGKGSPGPLGEDSGQAVRTPSEKRSAACQSLPVPGERFDETNVAAAVDWQR